MAQSRRSLQHIAINGKASCAVLTKTAIAANHPYGACEAVAAAKSAAQNGQCRMSAAGRGPMFYSFDKNTRWLPGGRVHGVCSCRVANILFLITEMLSYHRPQVSGAFCIDTLGTFHSDD